MIVCIDPGHGGEDPGAVFRDYLEKDFCLQICWRLYNLLRVHGYQVIATRQEDIFVPIWTRSKIANEAKADVFISIHCNADPDNDALGKSEAKGQEIWIYQGSLRSRLLADFLGGAIRGYFVDEPWRGVKETTHLGVLRETWMPAALIEVGFIDNSETVRRLADTAVQQEIARALLIGLDNFFGSSFKTAA